LRLGFEAKSCSEFRAEAVPWVILPHRANCHDGSCEQMFGAD
jgi:hypothetical protein